MSTRNNETNRQQASTYSVSGFGGRNGEMAGQGAQSLFTSVSVDLVNFVDWRLR